MPDDAEEFRIITIFDLDGTITKRDTFLAFLIYIIFRRPARWVRAPLLVLCTFLYAIGHRSNSWLKEKFLIHIVGGLHNDRLEVMSRRFNGRVLDKLIRDESRREIEKCKANGAVVLVSASPDIYVKDLARRLGFPMALSTQCEVSDSGIVTGRLEGENCHGLEKIKRLQSGFPGFNLADNDMRDTQITVFTDHHSDLPLLEIADTAVAICPSRNLKKIALDRGFEIRFWS